MTGLPTMPLADAPENKHLGDALTGPGYPAEPEPVPVSAASAAGIPIAAHTPGPWSVEPNAYHSAYHWVRSFHPRHICKVEQDPLELADGSTLDIGLANARLIAAAPELLEALRLALPTLEGIATELSDDIGATIQEGGKPTEEAFDAAHDAGFAASAARTAIFKATGAA